MNMARYSDNWGVDEIAYAITTIREEGAVKSVA